MLAYRDSEGDGRGSGSGGRGGEGSQAACSLAPPPLFSSAQRTTRSYAETRSLASSLTSTQGSPLVSDHSPSAHGSSSRCLQSPDLSLPLPHSSFSFTLPNPMPLTFLAPQARSGILTPNTSHYQKKVFLLNCYLLFKILMK